MFMNDTFSSTLNSSELDSLSLSNTMGGSSSQQNSQHHHQQMQQQQSHYEMLQQQNGGGGINAEGQVIIGHQLQQLVKLQNQQHQIQSQVCSRFRFIRI